MTELLEPPADTTEEQSTEMNMEWYRPSAAIQEFHLDTSFVRALIGGRGAGKTAAVCVESIRHCYENAGAKAIFARKTETSQVGSTIDTLLWCFAQLGDFYDPTRSHGLFRTWNDGLTFRVPSRLAIQKLHEASLTRSKSDLRTWVEQEGKKWCSEIQMKGLPHVSAGDSKLRGMECSMMVFVEADQIEERAFMLSFACLRWKGADPATCNRLGFIRDRSIILDTNPPGQAHWIAKREEAEEAKGNSKMRFWHLCTDDNAHNLPPNYIEETIMLPYEGNAAMIERMRYGRYADAYDGKPVYYAYKVDQHEGRDLPWPKGAYLIRGHDVGTNAATIFSAYWLEDGTEYWHDLYEYYVEGSDTDSHAREVLKATELEFPFWNDRTVCAGVQDFIDPAAANSSYTRQIVVDGKSVKESALNIFRTYGIYPSFMTTARGLMETIGIVNRLLQKKDRRGAPVYRVDTKGCPRLVRGYRGGYRWPPADEKGATENIPLKGLKCENLDHCFVAGTKVLTTRGNIPIETVQIGDYAITRNGARRITATMSRVADVYRYITSNGTEIECTEDHPFWSESRNTMIRVDCMTQGDTLNTCGQADTQSRESTDAFIADRSSLARTAAVFDLTVDTDHEFYANGILVSNCQDAARYAKCNALKLLKADIEQANKPIPWSRRPRNPNPPKRR